MDGLGGAAGRNGGRAMNAQRTSQATPSAPVVRNAALQPYSIASGPRSSGIITAPMVPPLKDRAIPRARRWAGSVSTAVRRPPGNVAPSPSPSTARATANPRNDDISACDMLAPVHTATASSIPKRRPMKSMAEPHTGLPSV